MYNAIDLFSGIGGNAYALRGLFNTVLYCDISSNARKCIRKNQERGLLDMAPIVSDVRQLDKETIMAIKGIGISSIREIDAIIGSFPCQGLSPLGLRNGFEHAETGLFHEIVRLASEIRPKMILLENVPNVLNKEMHTICTAISALNYELRWCVLGAHALGALQVRNRWFCLCVRTDISVQDDAPLMSWTDVPPIEQFRWVDEPRRTSPPLEDVYRSARCALLGNSVVPDVVRMAFFFLSSGMRDISSAFDGGDHCVANMDADLLEANYQEESEVRKFPRCGVFREGRVYTSHIPSFPRPNINVRLLATPPVSVSKKVRSPLVTECVLRSYSTPRKGAVIACKTLTERSARDLPTQIKFATCTPEEDRQYQISAEWVTWLMGYPRGYTQFAD